MITEYLQRRAIRNTLKEVYENWFAVEGYIRDYTFLFGYDDWLKKYVNRHVDDWNKQVQRGRR